MSKHVYKELLSTSRFRQSTATDRSLVQEAESDRGRLLYCPAFRRLQQKAQVFSMEPNAAVRSRLTHSLEVSQMGRYIADLLGPRLVQKGWAEPTEATALVTFVETACLMHDIGNPPFGHFGEAAIREWFSRNGRASAEKALNSARDEDSNPTNEMFTNALSDFIGFDGNPQGLRIVTKLQRNSDEFGLNLTKTTIAAFLKYVRCTSDAPSGGFSKKAGFFQTEVDIVRDVWQNFKYKSGQRYPLAYVMEAADDLAYCISDLEDSIEKQLLVQETAIKDIYQLWQDKCKDKGSREFRQIEEILRRTFETENPSTFTDFRTSLNRVIVSFCVEQYVENHEKILDGNAGPLLNEDSAAGSILDTLKKYCRTHVYRHESVQKVELAGYSAIFGLLENFRCILEASRDRFDGARMYMPKDSDERPIVLEQKYLKLFPKNYLAAYDDAVAKLKPSAPDFLAKEWSLRAHLITDFIAGMTDDFAMLLYRTLSGMRL